MGLQRVGRDLATLPLTFSHIGLGSGCLMGQPASRESTQTSESILLLPFAFQESSRIDGPPGEIGNVGPQVGVAAHGMHFICFCGGAR